MSFMKIVKSILSLLMKAIKLVFIGIVSLTLINMTFGTEIAVYFLMGFAGLLLLGLISKLFNVFTKDTGYLNTSSYYDDEVTEGNKELFTEHHWVPGMDAITEEARRKGFHYE